MSPLNWLRSCSLRFSASRSIPCAPAEPPYLQPFHPSIAGPTQCRANVNAHDRWRVPSRSSLVVHSEADCVLSDALPQACQGAAAALLRPPAHPTSSPDSRSWAWDDE